MTVKFTIGSTSFELPARQLATQSAAGLSYLTAVDAANLYARAKQSIENDGHLSGAGKLAKLKPLADGLWKQIFVSMENIANEGKHFDAREKRLFAVSEISTPYEVSRDREIRDWFRSLGRDETPRVIEAMKAGGEHAELVGALLRSPVPLGLDAMLTNVREVHEENCKEAAPGEYVLIEEGRASVQWAERGMGFVIGISQGLTERTVSEVLRLALETGHDLAAMALGDAKTIAQVRHAMASEQQQRIAA